MMYPTTKEFLNILNDFGKELVTEDLTYSNLSQRYKIIDESDKKTLYVLVPEYQKDEIDIELLNERIYGEDRKFIKISANTDRELFFAKNKFNLKISITKTIDTENIKSNLLNNGVLKITLPLKPEEAPKKIEIV